MVSSVSSPDLTIARLMKYLDNNDDGTVNEDEIVANRSENVSAARASELFNQIDWDKDGNLSDADLSAAYRLISDQSLSVLLDTQSVDTADIARYNSELTSDATSVFLALDTDSDGLVNATEFSAGRHAGTVSRTETLWNQINGDQDVTGDGLTMDQFATGVESTISRAAERATAKTYSTTVNKVNDLNLGNVNLGTDNASDLFAMIDEDRDGMVSQTDFLSALPSSVTTAQATAIWNKISTNGSGDGSYLSSLSENQFTTGFYALHNPSADTTGVSLDSDVMDELMTLLNTASTADLTARAAANAASSEETGSDEVTVSDEETSEDTSAALDSTYSDLITTLKGMKDRVPRMYDLGTDNQSDMFSILDSDRDGAVTEGEFLSARPSSVSQAQAQATWDALVANSGSSDSGSLQENEFVSGLNNLWGGTLTSEEAVKLNSLLYSLEGNAQSVLKLGTSNPSDMFAQIDSDRDGLISREDVVAAKAKTATTAQADALWNQLVLNSGSTDTSMQLTESQFVAGYTASLPDSLDTDTIELLSSYLQTIKTSSTTTSSQAASDSEDTTTVSESGVAVSETFDLSLFNASDIFALSDQDQDGWVSKEDFQAYMKSTLTTGDAERLWNSVVANSGVEDLTSSLTEGQFVTGYNATPTDLLSTANEYVSVTSLAEFLQTVRDAAPAPFDMSSLDPDSFYSQMDGDEDDSVSRQDFLNNVPSDLSEADANALWDLIVFNGDGSSSGESLSRDQFVSGYNATDSSVLERGNSAILDQMMTALEGYVNSEQATDGLTVSAENEVSASIDANNNSQISRQELLDQFSRDLTYAESAFGEEAARLSYLTQRLTDAMALYQG